MPSRTPTIEVLLQPDDWSDHLARETRKGLASNPPWIPPVWFYDEAGSRLFDEITRLPEYYPTRAERSILERHASEIAATSSADTLVELGSGTSTKTRLLLDAMAPLRFSPFDVSEPVLRSATLALSSEYPSLDLHAVVGDFHRHLAAVPRHGRRLVAFLGGTIGNLDRLQRSQFFSEIRDMLGGDEHLLLGTDLVKAPDRLIAAYDDDAGVTAAFNLNALAVMNRELGANFDLDAYEHRAHWDDDAAWIEMRLVARSAQQVQIADLELEREIDEGAWIRTEISAKFTPRRISQELRQAGLLPVKGWTDENGDYLLSLIRPMSSHGPGTSG